MKQAKQKLPYLELNDISARLQRIELSLDILSERLGDEVEGNLKESSLITLLSVNINQIRQDICLVAEQVGYK